MWAVPFDQRAVFANALHYRNATSLMQSAADGPFVRGDNILQQMPQVMERVSRGIKEGLARYGVEVPLVTGTTRQIKEGLQRLLVQRLPEAAQRMDRHMKHQAHLLVYEAQTHRVTPEWLHNVQQFLFAGTPRGPLENPYQEDPEPVMPIEPPTPPQPAPTPTPPEPAPTPEPTPTPTPAPTPEPTPPTPTPEPAPTPEPSPARDPDLQKIYDAAPEGRYKVACEVLGREDKGVTSPIPDEVLDALGEDWKGDLNKILDEMEADKGQKKGKKWWKKALAAVGLTLLAAYGAQQAGDAKQRLRREEEAMERERSGTEGVEMSEIVPEGDRLGRQQLQLLTDEIVRLGGDPTQMRESTLSLQIEEAGHFVHLLKLLEELREKKPGYRDDPTKSIPDRVRDAEEALELRQEEDIPTEVVDLQAPTTPPPPTPSPPTSPIIDSPEVQRMNERLVAEWQDLLPFVNRYRQIMAETSPRNPTRRQMTEEESLDLPVLGMAQDMYEIATGRKPDPPAPQEWDTVRPEHEAYFRRVLKVADGSAKDQFLTKFFRRQPRSRRQPNRYGGIAKRLLEIDPSIDVDVVAPKGSKRGGALKRYKKSGGSNPQVLEYLGNVGQK